MRTVFNIIGALTMIIGLTVGSSIPCWYTQVGEVVKENRILTEDGNVWAYDSEIQVGEKVKVYFHDGDTPNKEDDSIWLVRVVK